MYQYLSQTAKEVLKLAGHIALQEKKDFVGTKHILLGILQHGLGIGAQVLQYYSISLSSVQDQMGLLIQENYPCRWVLGKPAGSTGFCPVIAHAFKEAERFKDPKVGTEYLLLGLLNQKDCVAEKALTNLGLTIEAAEKRIALMQGRPKLRV